jgi:large subunit ribosomal protein L18
MKILTRIAKRRERRMFRVRNKVRSTGRLRLSVFRSNNHISAQIIDDAQGRTIVSASSLEAELGGAGRPQDNAAAAARVGAALGQRALAQGVTEVAFDRGRYKFHGRVAALAQAAREAGLQF